MRAGWIGLGRLGRAMAERLLSQGVELTVWNRTPGKAEGLAARAAASPREVIAGRDVVFLCLFDSDAVQAVLDGDDGLLAEDLAGKVVVDTTTNHHDRVEAFHAAVRERGGRYLEAPVLGSVVPASQGKLTVVVGGDAGAFERVRPLLGLLAGHVFFLEKPALATRMKLVNNLVLGVFMAALADAAALGESAGIERERVLDILAVGGGNSAVLGAKRDRLLAEDFSPHFTNALIHKDLSYLQDLARSLGRPLFSGAVIKELYGMAVARGWGGEDFSGVFRVVRGGSPA